MSEEDHHEIRELLKGSIPPAEAELRRDLWPAMSRAIESRTSRVPWYDWALAGLGGAVLAAFPDVFLVLVYHL